MNQVSIHCAHTCAIELIIDRYTITLVLTESEITRQHTAVGTVYSGGNAAHRNMSLGHLTHMCDQYVLNGTSKRFGRIYSIIVCVSPTEPCRTLF